MTGRWYRMFYDLQQRRRIGRTRQIGRSPDRGAQERSKGLQAGDVPTLEDAAPAKAAASIAGQRRMTKRPRRKSPRYSAGRAV
jgi:hypothetical protein